MATINVGDTVKVTKPMGFIDALNDPEKQWKVKERLPFGRVVIEAGELTFQLSESRLEKVEAK